MYQTLLKRNLLVIIIVGFIAFSNMFSNSFVWLDHPYLLDNPKTQTANFVELFKGSALTAEGYYRPIAALYLASTRMLFQDQAAYYHLLQLCLRLLNTYLLFRVFLRFFKKPLSLTLALLYLIHPLNEAQAVFISSVADILYVTFGLTALLIGTRVKQSMSQLVLVQLLLLGSLLTKESGVLFVAVLVLYHYFFARKNLKSYVIAAFVTTGSYLALRYIFQGFYHPKFMLYPMARLSIFERLINIPQILYFYISRFFYPRRVGGLHIWGHTTVGWDTFYQPLILDALFFVVLGLAGLYVYKKNHKAFSNYLYFLIFYLLGQVLYLQIFPLDYTVSSQWFVFSMIGLFGVIGTGIKVTSFTPLQLRVFVPLVIIIMVTLTSFTIQKNAYWKNDISLFTRWATVDDNFVIENWLANAYINEKDYHSALIHANKSVTMFPYDNNLSVQALIYEQLGDIPRAKQAAEKAMNADNYASGSHDPQTYKQLIQFLLRNQEHIAGRQLMQLATTDNPNDAYFWSMLALENYILGDIKPAEAAIQRAYQLSPEIDQVQGLHEVILHHQPLE